MIFINPLFVFLIILACCNAKINVDFSIKYASIFKALPQLKIHHIVIIKEDPMKDPLYAIDFSPIIDTKKRKNVDLALNRNIPAEVRIRQMDNWSLDEWYNRPTTNVNNIKNEEVREVVKAVLNKWKDYSKQKLSSDEEVMNLYKLNCQHFSNFVVKELEGNPLPLS